MSNQTQNTYTMVDQTVNHMHSDVEYYTLAEIVSLFTRLHNVEISRDTLSKYIRAHPQIEVVARGKFMRKQVMQDIPQRVRDRAVPQHETRQQRRAFMRWYWKTNKRS